MRYTLQFNVLQILTLWPWDLELPVKSPIIGLRRHLKTDL